ncbi:MAG: hypothetical protein LBF93_03545 [Zoogloeaceae bacterium]|jgi:hypothetical protein|nr:hypothetical protein [Zoogloeaceae bacterium]
MADKYLARVSGKTRQQSPVAASAGTSDAGKIVALNSAGKIDATALPDGLGANVITATASESLSAGAFVNLYSNAGTFSARLADNSNGRSADGFVLASVSSSATATVYPLGETNSGVTGLTVGVDHWLGVTGGTIATPLDETSSGNAGYVSQYLGKAKSAAELVTVRDESVIL